MSRSGLVMGWAAVLACLWAGGCRSVTPVTVHGDRAVTFRAEIAASPVARRMGLMFRKTLPADAGMLFVYRGAEPRGFWMLHTSIPLDMIFLDERKRILNIEEAAPCRSAPCRRYRSRGEARYVLEINRGLSRRYGFRKGGEAEFEL